jgi:hypothetical protein
VNLAVEVAEVLQVVLRFLNLAEQRRHLKRALKLGEPLELKVGPELLQKQDLQHRQLEPVPQHPLQHKYNIWQHQFSLLLRL